MTFRKLNYTKHIDDNHTIIHPTDLTNLVSSVYDLTRTSSLNKHILCNLQNLYLNFLLLVEINITLNLHSGEMFSVTALGNGHIPTGGCFFKPYCVPTRHNTDPDETKQEVGIVICQMASHCQDSIWTPGENNIRLLGLFAQQQQQKTLSSAIVVKMKAF